jgi:hypothetical protein
MGFPFSIELFSQEIGGNKQKDKIKSMVNLGDGKGHPPGNGPEESQAQMPQGRDLIMGLQGKALSEERVIGDAFPCSVDISCKTEVIDLIAQIKIGQKTHGDDSDGAGEKDP